MKSFKNLPRSQKILIVITSMIVVAIYSFSGNNSDNIENAGYSVYPNASSADYPASTPQPVASSASRNNASGPGQEVALMDQGLQMQRGTYTIPDGWKLIQDIATNPTTGGYTRYRMDILGTQGELIRGLGVTRYTSLQGQNFQQIWPQKVMQGIQGELTNISLGNLQPSSMLQNSPSFKKAAQKATAQGMPVHGLEVSIRGSRNGQAFGGMAYIIHFTTPNMPNSGVFTASVVLSPEKLVSTTLQINEQINNSYQPNPQYQQRMAQVQQNALQQSNAQHQQWMANSRAQHQQRMADNQARFNASQQNIQSLSNTYDAQNQQWMDNFRNSGSYGSTTNSGYSSQDAIIDGIYERSTFNDPYSGQQINRDGQYDYNYTNGLGDYYRTNDPSFNPNSLQGDWQEITPQNPGY